MLYRIAVAGVAIAAACTAGIAAPRKPAGALIVTNARAVSATDVAVRVGEGTVKLLRPLAPGATATLRLPKTADCIVAVSIVFEDESVADSEEFDICREKAIRLTD